jgi:predicted transcriptional regulator
MIETADLRLLLKLQARWNKITQNRKKAKSFLSPLSYLDDSELTVADISKRCGLSERTVQDNLAYLRAIGLVYLNHKVSLTPDGRRILGLLKKHGLDSLTRRISNYIEAHKLQAKICGKCAYYESFCDFDGHCDKKTWW